MELSKRQTDLLAIAEKGGNDASLILLDRIHEMQDEMAAVKERCDKMMEMMAEREPMPEMPNPLPVELKGAEIVTIKGKSGDDGKTPTHEELLSLIKPLIPEVKDGKTPTKQELMNLIQPLIPQVQDGEDGEDGKDADESRIIASVLEQIPKPDIKSMMTMIEQLKSEMDNKIKALPESKPFNIFGGGKTKILTLDLSNQLNGSTKTFTIGTHFGIVGVYSSSTPFVFRPTIDYQETGRTIVFDAAIDAPSMLAAGQTLIVHYLR